MGVLQKKETELDRYDLGDAIGDDAKLSSNLKEIQRSLKQNVISERGRALVEWITGLKADTVKWCSKGCAFLQASLMRFALISQHGEVLSAKAREIDADAAIKHAQAEQIRAEAEATRATTKIKENAATIDQAERILKLQQKIKKLGIEPVAEFDQHGRLEIGFTKKQDHPDAS